MEAKDYLSGVYLDNHKFSKEDTIRLMEDYYNYRVEYERQKQLKKFAKLIKVSLHNKAYIIVFPEFLY